jgi:hypothetical protein
MKTQRLFNDGSFARCLRLQMEIANVNWFFLWEFEAALTVFGFWLSRAVSKGL